MKRIISILIVLGLLAACADDFKDKAVASFKAVVNSVGVETMTMDGVAHVKITSDAHIDFALDSSSDKDVYMAFIAEPFLEAGLDVSLLPDTVFINGDMLVFTFDLKDAKSATDASSQLSNLLTANRSLLTYHEELDHYGIKLGDHKFEWAKTKSTNDKDAVFILDGDTLVSYGVDLTQVTGWVATEMDGVSLLLLPVSLD